MCVDARAWWVFLIHTGNIRGASVYVDREEGLSSRFEDTIDGADKRLIRRPCQAISGARDPSGALVPESPRSPAGGEGCPAEATHTLPLPLFAPFQSSEKGRPSKNPSAKFELVNER